jgi:hypothetical protein
MKTERFNKIVEDQLERIRSVLVKKAGEYNLEEDRLGFFKRSAAFAQETPEQALYGFLLKHLQSITDMVQRKNIKEVTTYIIIHLPQLHQKTK